MFRIIFLFLFVLLSCKEKFELDKGFAQAYAELRVAEQEYGESESGKIIRLQILQKYELDADSFEKKIEDIKKEPENWVKFQKVVVDILDSMSKI